MLIYEIGNFYRLIGYVFMMNVRYRWLDFSDRQRVYIGNLNRTYQYSKYYLKSMSEMMTIQHVMIIYDR